jgi:hypothetical protein
MRRFAPAPAMRHFAALLLLALLAGCAGAGGPASSGPSTSTLEAGPGTGYLSRRAPYLRPLRAGVAATAILTVGDTLFPSRPSDETFVFLPRPRGLAARSAGSGLVEVYATHELGWETGAGGAPVSRLLLNQRSAGVLNADLLLDGSEDYALLSSAKLVGAREGFLGLNVLIQEASIDGPRHGVVAAVDVRGGTVSSLPWMGRFRHHSTLILRHSSGNVVAIETEAGVPGESQLWMYVASSATDLLAGRGRLHVLRANAPSFGSNTGYASMATRSRPLSGRFVPCDNPAELADARQPDALEARAQAAGCLNFVHLGGAEADPEGTNRFYFTDAGAPSPADPATGGPVTEKGRLYRAELDPIDPTRLARLEVVLDGDENDDLYRPEDLAADEDGLMIQENPGARGLHPARILRYEPLTRRLEAVAECVERDPQGRLIPEGTGGAWATTGITDASALFGEGAWLVLVQAPTEWRPFGYEGGGQLVLLRVRPGRSGGEAPPSGED